MHKLPFGSSHGFKLFTHKNTSRISAAVFFYFLLLWRSHWNLSKTFFRRHYDEFLWPDLSSPFAESQWFHLAHIAPFIFIMLWHCVYSLKPSSLLSCLSPLCSTKHYLFYFILHLLQHSIFFFAAFILDIFRTLHFISYGINKSNNNTVKAVITELH